MNRSDKDSLQELNDLNVQAVRDFNMSQISEEQRQTPTLRHDSESQQKIEDILFEEKKTGSPLSRDAFQEISFRIEKREPSIGIMSNTSNTVKDDQNMDHIFLPIQRAKDSPLLKLKQTQKDTNSYVILDKISELKVSRSLFVTRDKEKSQIRIFQERLRNLRGNMRTLQEEVVKLRKECLKLESELEAQKSSHQYTTDIKMKLLRETLVMEKQRSNRLISELKNQSLMMMKIKKKLTEFLRYQRRQSHSCSSKWTHPSSHEPLLQRQQEQTYRKKSLSQMTGHPTNDSMAESDFVIQEEGLEEESILDIDMDNADTIMDIVFQQAIKNRCDHVCEEKKSPVFNDQKSANDEWTHIDDRTAIPSIYTRPDVEGSVMGVGQKQGDAAPWTPNDRFDFCQQCKMKFIFILRRKHHCRVCGKLVCDKCSPWRDFARGYGDVRVRACDKCHFKKERMRSLFNQKESIYSSSFQAPSSILHKF